MPLPGTFLLIALGSVVAQGELELWRVIAVSAGAAILGDQIGYVAGRTGGRRAAARLGWRGGGTGAIARAELFSARWGGLSIFFSRWLVTALGPWLNVTNGIARYPWPKFLAWDIAGEATWVTIYVGLGVLFSDRVNDLADLVSSAGWLLLALVVAVASGWELRRQVRRRSGVVRGRYSP